METQFDQYFLSLRGKRIAVLGLGVSNRPLVKLLLRYGCTVTGCDRTPREKLDAEVGAKVELKVLWAANEEGTSADTKASKNAKVTAQVVKHLRGHKVIVYKRRPKKGYERTQGHRQNLTQIKITDIQL